VLEQYDFLFNGASPLMKENPGLNPEEMIDFMDALVRHVSFL
jgi:hypothetical protein